MPDYLVQMSITIILSMVKESFKNPAKKADLKKALAKVRDSINLLYADDPAF